MPAIKIALTTSHMLPDGPGPMTALEARKIFESRKSVSQQMKTLSGNFLLK